MFSQKHGLLPQENHPKSQGAPKKVSSGRTNTFNLLEGGELQSIARAFLMSAPISPKK
jgi:hypothetical protein